MRLNTGQIVRGRYRIARLLGQGGMGAVYRAWDLTLNIPVALKEMLPDPALSPQEIAEFRQQFQQEARTLASLIHPNLPRVTDFFDWQGNDYLVMDFIEGESLDTLIERQGALPEEQVVRIAIQLLEALAACHARQVLHRDIKPQNIILCQDGRVVLVDFGLVKLWDPQKPQTQRIIRGMGTREYASPEQFGLRGAHTEPRSDIYSLGATLYHALVGQVPSSALGRLANTEPLTEPRHMGVQVRPHIEQVILRALSLAPDQRFSSVHDMHDALVSGIDPVTRYTDPRRQQPAVAAATVAAAGRGATVKMPRSGRWRLELVTALLLALIAALSLQSLLFASRTPPEQFVGLSIGALILGALGWFIGDTIFQALTMPETSAAPQPAAGGGRPTQRLVLSTRKLMRRLTTGQQIVLVIGLVVVAALAAWLLGPVIAGVPFLWNNLPSYAIAAPLVYAAVGRRPGRAGVAHALVATVGGMALKASVATTTEFGPLLLAALAGGLLIEGLAFLANRTFLKV